MEISQAGIKIKSVNRPKLAIAKRALKVRRGVTPTPSLVGRKSLKRVKVLPVKGERLAYLN